MWVNAVFMDDEQGIIKNADIEKACPPDPAQHGRKISMTFFNVFKHLKQKWAIFASVLIYSLMFVLLQTDYKNNLMI